MATTPLFERARGDLVCPAEFCSAHCTAETCKCAPYWCDQCKYRHLLARRPTERPRVRYTPPAPVQGALFQETP